MANTFQENTDGQSELKVEAGQIKNEKVHSFTMDEIAKSQQEVANALSGNGPSLQAWAKEQNAKHLQTLSELNFGDSRPHKKG
jgi:hypothetical protein